MNRSQKILARFLVGALYGGLLGLSFALLTGNVAMAWAVAMTATIAVAASMNVVAAMAMTVIISAMVIVGVIISAIMAGHVIGTVTVVGTRTEALAIAGTVALFLVIIATLKSTTPEALLDKHVVWLFSLVMGLFQLVFNLVSPLTKPQAKKQSWDRSLVVFLAHELAEVYPMEWNVWQHWISDILESRQCLQARRINHRLVALITFYELFRFSWHIGIEKMFVITFRLASK
jgi:hypothetical protein